VNAVHIDVSSTKTHQNGLLTARPLGNNKLRGRTGTVSKQAFVDAPDQGVELLTVTNMPNLNAPSPGPVKLWREPDGRKRVHRGGADRVVSPKTTG
jgi:hypothetical protein